jgi:hypothetical protein
MKNLFLMTTLIASTAFAQSTTVNEKNYYQTLDPKVRLEILAHSQVRKSIPLTESATAKKEDDKDNLTDKIDVVKYLSESCGFEYTRDAEGNPVRPTLNCNYDPRAEDDGFNGMTAKFGCQFEMTNKRGEKKLKTMKVKYDPFKQQGGGHKEIPQAVMGTLFARLLGFHTGNYCPADVVCNNCPNDNPWELSKKSTGPAAAGSRVEFKNVVASVNLSGYKIMDTKNTDPVKAIGFYFQNELNKIYPANKQVAEQLKTERDSLTLWINFAVARDAGAYNTKMYCVKSAPVTEANPQPKCLQSVAIINDYGNAFGYRGQKEKISLSKFSGPALRSSFGRDDFAQNDELITTGANGTAGADGVKISKAGRDLFVKSAEAITDQQLEDVLKLSQIHLTSDSSIQKWKDGFRRKVKEVKEH